MGTPERLNSSEVLDAAFNEGPPQNVSLSAQQVEQAASAGVDLLGRETTLIPGNLREQLAVLEVILRGITSGTLVVVTLQQLAVESKPDDNGKSET